MKLTKYANDIPLQRRMELLDHFPSFSEDMQTSKELVSYFDDTVKEWWTDGNTVVLYDHITDTYEDKLPFLKEYKHGVKIEPCTIWKPFVLIAENILQLDKKHEFLNNKLYSILRMPCCTMTEALLLMKEVSNFAISAEKEGDDYYKETLGTVFSMLLPYKLNAIGMRGELELATFSIHDNDFSSPAFQKTYLSQLSETFYYTLQGIRGCSLSETKQKLRCLRSTVYMIISELYQEGFCDKVMVGLYGTYISKMLQAGIGENIANDVCEMVNRKVDWIDVVKDGFENYKEEKIEPSDPSKSVNTIPYTMFNQYTYSMETFCDFEHMVLASNEVLRKIGKMDREVIQANIHDAIVQNLIKTWKPVTEVSYTLPTRMLGYLRYYYKDNVLFMSKYPCCSVGDILTLLMEEDDLFLLSYDPSNEDEILGVQVSPINDPNNIGKCIRMLSIQIPSGTDYKLTSPQHPIAQEDSNG